MLTTGSYQKLRKKLRKPAKTRTGPIKKWNTLENQSNKLEETTENKNSFELI